MNLRYPSLFLCAALVSPMTEAEESSGHAVFARYVDALGGAAALAEVQSLTANGSYTFEGGPSGTISLYLSRPDKILFRVELDGIGVIAQGTDGETAWRSHPAQGFSVLGPVDMDLMHKWLAHGFSLLPDAAAYREIGAAEPALHDGRSCMRVALTLAATGETHHDCYDPDTGHLIGNTEFRDRQPVQGWIVA